MSRHTDLIDAVNDAKTDLEHQLADAYLTGWLDAMDECGRRLCFVQADEHTTARFGDRPMCCGVLLDWSPADAADARSVTLTAFIQDVEAAEGKATGAQA